MKITNTLTDDTVAQELGSRVARERLALNKDQATVAAGAGISKRSLERLEAGHPGQLVTLLRVLRYLGRLEDLEHVLQHPELSPMEILASKRPEPRKRATARKRSQAKPGMKPWKWGDEQ